MINGTDSLPPVMRHGGSVREDFIEFFEPTAFITTYAETVSRIMGLPSSVIVKALGRSNDESVRFRLYEEIHDNTFGNSEN